MLKRIYEWLDERYQLQELKDFASHKQVPIHHHSVWYYMGGVTLFLFIVQVLTGSLLLLYYRVGENQSFESVRFIMSQVQFGWLIRSIHSWSANLMVLAMFLHMYSVFFTKAYRKPRELTWVTGFLLLVIALTFGFSGYLLPWNQLALFATKVGTQTIGTFPRIGGFILRMVRGSEDVTGATLARFFGLHVAVLPMIFTLILAAHILLIQRQGISEPEEWKHAPPEKRRMMPFFPNFMLRDMLLWLIVLNVLAVLAVLFPWELGQKADPFGSAPSGIKPEWYFLFAYQTLKLIPSKVAFLEGDFVGVLLFSLGGLIWLLVPFWEPWIPQKLRNRVVTAFGVLVVAYVAIMTIWGYRS